MLSLSVVWRQTRFQHFFIILMCAECSSSTHYCVVPIKKNRQCSYWFFLFLGRGRIRFFFFFPKRSQWRTWHPHPFDGSKCIQTFAVNLANLLTCSQPRSVRDAWFTSFCSKVEWIVGGKVERKYKNMKYRVCISFLCEFTDGTKAWIKPGNFVITFCYYYLQEG